MSQHSLPSVNILGFFAKQDPKPKILTNFLSRANFGKACQMCLMSLSALGNWPCSGQQGRLAQLLQQVRTQYELWTDFGYWRQLLRFQ